MSTPAATGRTRLLAAATGLLAVAALVGSCSSAGPAGRVAASPTAPATVRSPEPPPAAPVAGTSAADVYAHTRAGMLSPAVAGERALVYVPNLADGTVSVIDQATLQVVDTLKVGREPQHVVPSWDLQTLWVNNNRGNSLSPIDPRTGALAGPPLPVRDPYNLYFTPDGRSAMVMAEALREIDFYDPHTFVLQSRLPLDKRCTGVNHLDFAADGSWFVATCEFSGQLVKVDVASRSVVGYLDLNAHGPSAPQDIKIDPAGQLLYVADMNAAGLHEIDAATFTETGFLPTGPETHGLYLSRDARYLYVANRGGMLRSHAAPFPHSGDDGSVSVVDVRTRSVVATWPIPGGGTPDMGNVSADGTRLWLSGRRSNVVYVFETGGDDPAAGHLLTEIPVGHEPHGLAVWPLPGRYSLGHTGILR
jgi:YVTN family beta-propeller protein